MKRNKILRLLQWKYFIHTYIYSSKCNTTRISVAFSPILRQLGLEVDSKHILWHSFLKLENCNSCSCVFESQKEIGIQSSKRIVPVRIFRWNLQNSCFWWRYDANVIFSSEILFKIFYKLILTCAHSQEKKLHSSVIFFTKGCLQR